MSNFMIVSVSPIELGSGIARATLRAGGVAILDAELFPSDCIDAALATLREAEGAGLRIACSQLATHRALVDATRGPLVLALGEEWPHEVIRALAHEHELWIEIGSGAELARLDASLPIAANVGRGSECGGAAGSESAFILAQHLARHGKHPFYIQGGIGIHSAAACRVAGAAGVVLDDALLLMRDAALPPKWRSVLERIAPEETAKIGRWRFANRPDFALSREVVRRADANAVRELLRWSDPSESLWPLGETAGSARQLAARFHTVGRYLRAIVDESAQHVITASTRAPLDDASPLAQSHGTRYPIVQGPMTRVSDRVELASSLAEHGALPLIALALMRAPDVEALLTDAKRTLRDRAWGIGILGFVPRELWEEQLAVVERVRPPFALIAGGRPDHAARLEALGIATYVHAPGAVLPMFLEQGARRLVFEGGECGGHVGPLHSFALWQIAIDRLLAGIPANESESVHALFAGGIHDALSAAMVAAMAAPLTARGMRIGVLMGTAYLFTEEVVRSGAITATFQQQAIACAATATIETKPGHSIRCVPTQFIDTFARTREMLAQTVSATELGDALEQLTVGRARVASKGLQRRGDIIEAVDEREQLAEGMFMIGEAATLRHARTTIAEVHHDVATGGTRLLANAARDIEPREQKSQKAAAVAIIGAGVIVPGAHDASTLWRNLLDRVDCVREIPRERWDWRLFYDEEPSARDKMISKWGTFIEPLPFDPLHYGIPPRSLPSIATSQLLALEATRRALRDAGYGDSIEDERLRERTSVVFAAGNTADLEQMYIARSTMPLVAPAADDACARMPEWTEESFPGILANVVAGRVANRFDLGGMNVALDAACAGSLAALDVAVRELEEGRADLVLTGGMELEQTPMAYLAFSKTKALSPRGRARVFDAGADGIVIGEGVVVLALKRVEDAERDGDRIYAVIRSVAGSSDGKGLGLTAPKPAGQRRAVARAHAQAGISARDLGMYEAHGTGTPVGDAAELETISVALRRAGAKPRSCAIGSAKSLVGHTRAAAGMVGLLKSALALHHRVLPPHAGVEQPMAELRDASSPLRISDTPQPWLDSGAPRRAGVSAFGFGGTNFHVVLEEYAKSAAPAGANRWPCELFLIDREELDRVEQAIEHVPFADLAYTCAINASPRAIAIVAANADELRRGIAAARTRIEDLTPAGDVAFLFPGQGSQSPGMTGELALYFDEIRDALEEAQRTTALPLTERIFPARAFSDEARAADERALADTRVAQPAIGAISCGVLDLLRRHGVDAARVAGHSYGEMVALHAAGVLTREELLRLSAARGNVMAAADAGAMAFVAATADAIQPHLATDVVIANYNAPEQIVISGAVEAIDCAISTLTTNGFIARRLNVSGAFHSPLMRSARESFANALQNIAPQTPRVPVHATRDGAPYDERVREGLLDQLEQPVHFVAQIEAMYAAGVRTFVEAGPGHVLTSLVRRILGERPHRALATDGGLRGYLEALAELWRGGVPIDVAALYAGRDVQYLDLERIAPPAAPGWMIDGGRIWKSDAAERNVGELPLLDRETVAQVVPQATHEDPLVAAYREYEETMRRFLEQQERVLMQVVGADATRSATPALPAPEAPAPKPKQIAAPQTATTPATVLSRDEIASRLVAVVSDRTGYPPSMLGLHHDLEAELGIDSIKRIEIVGAVQKSLPGEIGAALQSKFDQLVRVKSLAQLIDAVMAAAATATPVETKEATRGVPRFVMRGTERPLSGVHRDPQAGLYVVTEDEAGVAEDVVVRLRARGAAAHLVRRIELESADALENRLLVLRHIHGPIAAIVHCAAIGRVAPVDAGQWQRDTNVVMRSLFRMLQVCAGELQQVVAVTQFGGEWGRTGNASGTAAAGAAHGILRTLHSEHPSIATKVLDFGDEVSAEAIVDELLTMSADTEIGYANGTRIVYTAATAPRDQVSHDFEPAEGWVVLATGGARGITAEICRDLAKPGVRLVLVGRTPLAEHMETESEIEAGRQALLAVLHARSGELERSEIEAEVRRIEALTHERRRERERQSSLEALRAAGAIVEYHALDVRDGDTFAAFIEELYARHGRIDAVVHGAGIIEDQWIENKDPESFDRVFDTKASSAWVLAQHLRTDTLRWIVFFGSTSGRFANPGQADYAAANEVVNRLAWQLDARTGARVAVINWGPWSGTGMASDGTRTLLESRGIATIEPEAGRRFFADELRFGRKGEVEIVAGDGPWSIQDDEVLSSVVELALFAMTIQTTAGATR